MSDLNQFEAFMHAYQNMVYSTAVRLLASDADAQDVAQDVFLKAYEHFEEIRNSPTAGGWLKTVTRNLCLNHLSRYRARWRFFSEMFSHDEEESFEERLPGVDLRTEGLDQADDRELLEQALHKLPESQRVPLVLYHFEDLGYEEIAARLRISLSKVKTDIHRGRAALKRKLTPHAASLGVDYA
jgi:RNA polymerase sigma-70 factor, ECF subfamily